MAGFTTAARWSCLPRIRELSRRRVAYLHLIEAKGSEIGLTDELHEHAQNNSTSGAHFRNKPQRSN
jgi:hypothetical protein